MYAMIDGKRIKQKLDERYHEEYDRIESQIRKDMKPLIDAGVVDDATINQMVSAGIRASESEKEILRQIRYILIILIFNICLHLN